MEKMNISFRSRLLTFVILAISSNLSATNSLDVVHMTLEDINRKLESGEITSVELVQQYLDRIAAYEDRGPKINALINLNPRALEIAAALDEERQKKGPRSRLHGIPIVVKDTIEVAGMPYTLGHPILADFDPGRDAHVIKRLRDAGAIMLAKANLTDILGTMGAAVSTLEGKNLNPYNPDYNPGGSSGGSGAAVAASFAPLALGADTGGSVLIPAADCGIFGMVATHGLVSGSGGIADSASLTRIGPMGKSTYDVAVLLSVMAGWDPLDAKTLDAIGHFRGMNFEEHLEDRDIAGFRFGVLRELFQSDAERAEALPVVEKAIEALKEAGATLVDPVFSGVNLVEMVKRKNSATNYFEYWPARDAYFATLPDHAPFHSVDRLIELLGRENVKGVSNLSQPLPDESDEYLAHHRTQEMMRNALIRLIDTLELDALIFPFSLKGPWRWDNATQKGKEETALAAHTRLPAIVVPAGYISGDRPIALGFIGKPFSDLTLLQAAHLYERIYPIRREPNLTP